MAERTTIGELSDKVNAQAYNPLYALKPSTGGSTEVGAIYNPKTGNTIGTSGESITYRSPDVTDASARIGDYVLQGGTPVLVPNSPTEIVQRYANVTGGSEKPVSISMPTVAAGIAQGATLGSVAGSLGGPVGKAVLGAIGGLVGGLSSVVDAQKEALEAWKKQEVVYENPVTFSRDPDGKLVANLDYSKMATGGVLSGSGVKEAQNKETTVELGDDGHLKIGVSPVFAGTNLYKSLVEQISSTYAGLTKDTPDFDKYITEIKQLIDSNKDQYNFEMQSYADYKTRFDAKPESIVSAYSTELAGYIDPEKMGDYTMVVISGDGTKEQSAKDFFDSVLNMNKDERNGLLKTLYEIIGGEDEDGNQYSEDQKAIAYGELRALQAASSNVNNYKDDKYQGMLDADIAVTFMSTFSPLGLNAGDVVKFVTGGNLMGGKQEYLNHDEMAQTVGIVGGVAAGLGAIKGLLGSGGKQGMIGNMLKKAPGTGALFKASLEGQEGGAIAFFAAHAGETKAVAKVLGASMGFNVAKTAIFDAALAGSKTVVSGEDFAKNFGEDFARDIIIDLVFQYYDAIKFEKNTVDSVVYVTRDVDGNVRVIGDRAEIDAAAGEEFIGAFSAQKTRAGDQVAIVASQQYGTQIYYNGIWGTKNANGEFVPGTPASANPYLPALRTGVITENSPEVTTNDIKSALAKSGVSTSAEVWEAPKSLAKSAETAGKIAKVESTKAGLAVNKALFNKNAVLDTVNDMAYAKDMDKTAWQQRSNVFANDMDAARSLKTDIDNGKFLKSTVNTKADRLMKFGTFTEQFGAYKPKVDGYYLNARRALEMAQLAESEKTEGNTRDYVKEALEKYGKYLTDIPQDRAMALDEFQNARKAYLADFVKSVKKSGMLDNNLLDNVTESSVQTKIGYVPLWGKKETYNGLLSRFYGISQERHPIKSWIREGELVDIDKFEDPLEADNRITQFFAQNMALNQKVQLTAEALDSAGLLVDNTPSPATIREKKLKSIKNKTALTKKMDSIIAEKKKWVDANIPSEGEYAKNFTDIYNKNKIDQKIQKAISNELNQLQEEGKELRRQLRNEKNRKSIAPRPESYIDGNKYAEGVKAFDSRNDKGYKKFASENLERISEDALPRDVEDFAMHVIRPGGDIDMYNKFLRDGDYQSVEEWAKQYIEDLPDLYADGDLEEIAASYFPREQAITYSKYDTSRANGMDYYTAQNIYYGELADLLSDKLIQALNGNYRLNKNTILYRGISSGGNKVNSASDLSWLKKGAQFRDNGFAFVSLSDNVAKGFAETGKGDKIVLRYLLPKGTDLFYFGAFGKGGGNGGAFVLPAGTEGIVEKVSTDKSGVTHADIRVKGLPLVELADAYQAKQEKISSLQTKIQENKQAQLEAVDNTKKAVAVLTSAVDKSVREAAKYNEIFGREFDVDSFMNTDVLPNISDAINAKDASLVSAVVHQAMLDAAPYTSRSSVLKRKLDEAAEEWREWAEKNIKAGRVSSKDKKELVDLVAAEMNGDTIDAQKMGASATAIGLGGRYPVTWYQDGKPYTRFIKYTNEHEKMLAEAITKLFTDKQLLKQPGLFSRYARGIANNFRLATTGWDPSRVTPNLARDTGRGEITSAGNSFADANKILSDTITAGVELGLYSEKQGKTLRQAIDNAAKKVAGETYNQAYGSPRKAATQLTKEYLSETGASPLRVFTYNLIHDKKAILEWPGDFFEGFTRKRLAKSEAAVALRKAQKEGKSFDEMLKTVESAATFAGKEYTANFSRKGELINLLGAYVPYLSSSFAGVDGFKRAYINNPSGVAKNFATFLLVYMILLADTLSDENSRKNYYRLSDYDRGNSIILALDNNTVLTIPLDQETASLLFPYRRIIETLNNVDPVSFFELIWGTVTEPIPFDLSGFSEGGGFNLFRGLERLGSQMAPTVGTAVYKVTTGRDPYYGSNLRVTDEELQAYGIYDPSAGDYTRTSKDSATLRAVSDRTGIPQWQLQSIVSSFGGNVGQYALNTIDKLSGATEERQGGKDFTDAIFKSFVATDSDNAANQFYAGIDELKGEKQTLLQKLYDLNQDMKTASGDALYELQAQYQKAKDDFATKVGDFVNQYLNAYEITGGLSKSQAMQIYYLFRLDDDRTIYETGSVAEYYAGKTEQQMKNAADAMAAPVLDKYYDQTKRGLYQDSDGTWRIYAPYGQKAFLNTIYGEGLAHEVNLRNILEGKTSNLKSAKTAVNAKRAAAANAGNWDERNRLGAEFDNQVIDAIAPYINRYGAENVLGNSTVLDYLSDWFFVPDSFIKTKKGKYVSLANNASTQEAFVRPYIKYLFGLATNYNSYNEIKLKNQAVGDFNF